MHSPLSLGHQPIRMFKEVFNKHCSNCNIGRNTLRFAILRKETSTLDVRNSTSSAILARNIFNEFLAYVWKTDFTLIMVQVIRSNLFEFYCIKGHTIDFLEVLFTNFPSSSIGIFFFQKDISDISWFSMVYRFYS